MSTTPFIWNKYRVFTIKYSLFGKVGRAVSYKQTASEAIKDVRSSILWSKHHTFEIKKVECEEYGRRS